LISVADFAAVAAASDAADDEDEMTGSRR